MFSQAQKQKAFDQALDHYQGKTGIKQEVQDKQSELIVYVDKDKKAHWAYKISFYVSPVKSGTLPAKPIIIVDAVSFHVYKEWNDIKTKSAK